MAFLLHLGLYNYVQGCPAVLTSMAETPQSCHNLALNLRWRERRFNGRLWRSSGLCATLRLPLSKRPGVRGYGPLVIGQHSVYYVRKKVKLTFFYSSPSTTHTQPALYIVRAQIEHFFSFDCPTHSINLPDTGTSFRQFPPNLDFGHNNEQYKHTAMGPARIRVLNETNRMGPTKLVHRTRTQANSMRSGRTYMPSDDNMI